MTSVTPLVPGDPQSPPSAGGAAAILATGARSGRLTYRTELPARAGRPGQWPDWAPPELIAALAASGVTAPWAHQAHAAQAARSGRNVVIATGTASGKSLGYLLPALTSVLNGGTALYIAPTRALAADQLRLVQSLGLRGVRAAVVDGDTPWSDRAWARSHASYLLTTPDMLHHSLLPQHARWNGFFRRLHYVIVDECHTYRGVFGSHVAHVLRRLRRIGCHHSAADPVFILASATISDPAGCGRAADRPARGRGHRGRRAARADDVRHVGAAAYRRPRRSGRAGPADGDGRGRAVARRPRHRASAGARVRAVAARRRVGGARRAPAPRRGRRAMTCARGSPRTGPDTCRPSAGRWSPRCAPGRSPPSPPPPRSSSAST